MIFSVKGEKEYKEKIRELRHQGWFLDTYTRTFSELKKGGRIAVVERGNKGE